MNNCQTYLGLLLTSMLFGGFNLQSNDIDLDVKSASYFTMDSATTKKLDDILKDFRASLLKTLQDMKEPQAPSKPTPTLAPPPPQLLPKPTDRTSAHCKQRCWTTNDTAYGYAMAINLFLRLFAAVLKTIKTLQT